MKFLGLLFLVILSVSACSKPKEGPFERTGRNVDDAVDDTKDAIEDVGDSIEDATDNINDD